MTIEDRREYAVVAYCNECGATKSWDAGDNDKNSGKLDTRHECIYAANNWRGTHALLHAPKRCGSRLS